MMIVNNPYKDVMEWGKVLTNKGFRFKGTFPGSKGTFPGHGRLNTNSILLLNQFSGPMPEDPGTFPAGGCLNSSSIIYIYTIYDFRVFKFVIFPYTVPLLLSHRTFTLRSYDIWNNTREIVSEYFAVTLWWLIYRYLVFLYLRIMTIYL